MLIVQTVLIRWLIQLRIKAPITSLNMKNLVLLSILAVCLQGCFGRVVVTKDDIGVVCGKEDSVLGFGPINITIEIPNNLWDASNYTIYAFENTSCAFTPETTDGLNPLISDNSSYFNSYKLGLEPQVIAEGDEGTCGVKRISAQKLSVDIAVVEGDLFTTNDKVFTVTCDYTPKNIDGNEVAEGDLIPTPPEIGGTASPNDLDRIYNLELINAETGRVVEGSVPIGTPVQLRVRAEGADEGQNGGVADDENGLQVSSCTATNSEGKNTVTLISDYCTEFKDGIDFVEKPDVNDRKGFSSVDMLSFSPAFEMFAIAGGPVDHVVIFSCNVVVCRIDGACDGDNCPSKKKKRSASPKLNEVSLYRARRAADAAGNVRLMTEIVVDEGQNGGNAGIIAGAGMTAEMTTLVVGLTALGVILLLCMVAAIVVAMRLTQSKKKTTKTVVHHDNPSYSQ
ncbi:unnamed protein product [Owenia fusiformis]|uniref:Uncharacterized protein n=1 Tax=Owenia fusiformis TaxID=6347 RepID=A0A8J1XMR5_OWEFU|nr:unnamed protein product [Owenia fusiformis]